MQKKIDSFLLTSILRVLSLRKVKFRRGQMNFYKANMMSILDVFINWIFHILL